MDPAAAANLRSDLVALIGALGARSVEVAPADHDALVAVTSHLPQALAVTLGARLAATGAADPRAFAVCGPGIASMLRLARSPVDLWSAIFAANAVPLAAELRAFAQALDAAADGLEQGDVARLASYFADAGGAVAALERTEGPERSSPYAVPTR